VTCVGTFTHMGRFAEIHDREKLYLRLKRRGRHASVLASTVICGPRAGERRVGGYALIEPHWRAERPVNVNHILIQCT